MKPSSWNPRSRIFVDEGSESHEGRPGGDVFGWRPEAYLRKVPGRETFARGDRVVKRYRGLEPAEVLRDLASGIRPRTAGRREYENLVALAGDGFPVPRALDWAEEPGALGGRGWSAVVMERVSHEETLRDRLAGEPSRGLEDGLLELVVGLHERGWFHKDLYLQHVVLTEDRGLVLLDLGRARRGPRVRRRWFVKDLAALAFSTPECVGAFARLRFLARYLDRRGVTGRAERRAWARAVAAKTRRIAAHLPRFGGAEVEHLRG